MSNLDFDIDSIISTLNTSAGHIGSDIMEKPILTRAAAGTQTVAVTSTAVLFATSNVANSLYYTYVSSGFVTIIQPGTYLAHIKVVVANDSAGPRFDINVQNSPESPVVYALLPGGGTSVDRTQTAAASNESIAYVNLIFTAAAGDRFRVFMTNLVGTSTITAESAMNIVKLN